MRKILSILLLFIVLFLTGCNNPTEQDNTPTFTVGMECGYAPFNWTENQKTETKNHTMSVI